MFGVVTGLVRAAAKKPSPGLLSGKTVVYGNNVSHSNRKTRRTWWPNYQAREFYSDILGHKVRVFVGTHALKCIDKAGGFDNYILSSSPKRLDSDVGNELKAKLQRALYEKRIKELEAVLQ
eukprot:TRINITY_DN6808_c0_g1_i1.p2 TRINITY_DN6808_c0_g1~~TRINITY_DN6808_c0_g1_i1.p2  ORF type:complete len:121 (-),score=20.76 TRINITY_DN6808_c0_g1_i1:242-604(-)